VISLVCVIVSTGSILVLAPDRSPKWWFVCIAHAIAAGFMFITIVAVSQSVRTVGLAGRVPLRLRATSFLKKPSRHVRNCRHR
jgi:hypothetical protein